jgi:hypothetical protein
LFTGIRPQELEVLQNDIMTRHMIGECGVAGVAMDTVLTFHAAIFESPLTPIVLP